MHKVRIHVGVETRISQPMQRADADILATLFERGLKESYDLCCAIRDEVNRQSSSESS